MLNVAYRDDFVMKNLAVNGTSGGEFIKVRKPVWGAKRAPVVHTGFREQRMLGLSNNKWTFWNQLYALQIATVLLLITLKHHVTRV